MLTSILPFTPEIAAQATDYCTQKSSEISPRQAELWDWTCERFEDADKMSSPLQASMFKFFAQLLSPKRILEIGCFTGFSALAWHEATQTQKAEIITLELDPKMIAASRETFDKYGLNDRVTLIEGPADETIKTLSGQFDLIFVDANKEGYEGYVKYILDAKLLSARGLIMCDNVFARGMTISTDANPYLPAKVRPYWTENGKALRKFCDFSRNDERIDAVLLPLFDGITLIQWRESEFLRLTN